MLLQILPDTHILNKDTCLPDSRHGTPSSLPCSDLCPCLSICPRDLALQVPFGLKVFPMV